MICGECIYFLAGAGCRKYGACIRFDTFATFCDDFVDVDEVRS